MSPPSLPPRPQTVIADFQRFLGNWWTDGRQHRCCYCGIQMRRPVGTNPPSDAATRDHVIPRAAKGKYLTIPACRTCNQLRGSMDMLEFLRSPLFQSIASRAEPARWSERDLCGVYALALVLNAAEIEKARKAAVASARAKAKAKAKKTRCPPSSSSPWAAPSAPSCATPSPPAR